MNMYLSPDLRRLYSVGKLDINYKTSFTTIKKPKQFFKELKSNLQEIDNLLEKSLSKR